MPLEDIEFAINPETRCPVVLLLDTSGSMAGERIQVLNMGITTFKREVEQDDTASLRVEVAVVTFDNSAQVIQDFTTVNNFIPPILKASGGTATGAGIELALNIVENRRSTYKNNGVSYYQPWIFLITDGNPTDSTSTWQNAAQRAKQTVANGKLSFFTVGVQGADMATLRQIAPSNTPPVMLDGLKFHELFRWLSQSVTKVSQSKVGSGPVELNPISGWASVNV